jgi:hypothetical protein
MTNYTKTMAEALNQVYLGEDNMALMKKAAGGANQNIKMKDGKLKMDSFTASAIMAVYKAVNPKNKKSMENMINSGSKSQIMKLQSLAMKQIKSGYHEEVELDEASKEGTVKIIKTKNGKFQIQKMTKGKFVDMGKPYNSQKEAEKFRSGQPDLFGEEVELDEAKYELYHKDFSSAMQHATKMAKKLHGITIDPKEIDDKVATGPSKPSNGKTNTYRLKGDKGAVQIQVYNKGGSKPFELNMYKEEVELDEGKILVADPKTQKVIKIDEKDWPKYEKKGYVQAEGLDKDDEKVVKKVVGKLKKASQAHAGQSVELQKALDEDGHTDVASAQTNVKVAMSALTKMSGELTKLNAEDSLPSWWTNKVAVAVDKLDGMADYLDTKVEEVVVEANSLAQQAAIAISKKERGNRPKKEESDIDEAVKVGDNIKVRLRRKGREYIEKGEVIKIDGDKITVKHDFSRTPSGVKMTDIVKEEVELDEGTPEYRKMMKNYAGSDDKKVFDILSKNGWRLGEQGDTLVRNMLKKHDGNIKKAADDIMKKYPKLKKEEVELDEKIEGLVTKAKKSGMPYGILKKVYDRGMAAYKTGHRPGTTSQQWAFARVNSFTTKSAGTWGKADADLAKQVRGESIEFDLDEASARADAMRAMRKDKSVDPADVDTDATDDDVKSASKNIIMQLRKSVSLRGNFKVEFMDKKKVKVSAKIAQGVQNKYNSMKKATDKEKFQAKISKSYKDMLSALKENYGNKQENTILDRVGKKLREIKNG